MSLWIPLFWQAELGCQASRHPIVVYFLNGFLSLRNGFVFINTIKKLIHLRIFFFYGTEIVSPIPFRNTIFRLCTFSCPSDTCSACTKIVWRYLRTLDCPCFRFIVNKMVEVVTPTHFQVNSNDLGTSEPEACATRNGAAMELNATDRQTWALSCGSVDMPFRLLPWDGGCV